MLEEKKEITVKLSTVILLCIIFILIVLLGIMYYQNYINNNNIINNNKNDASNNVETTDNVKNTNNVETAKNEESSNNTATTNNAENTNVVELTKKNEFKISFIEEEYKSHKESGEVVFENKRNLPVITNEANQSAADKIVKSLTFFSDEEWKNIKETSDTNKDNAFIISGGEYNAGVQYLFNTYLVKDNYLVFKAIRSGNFGGVNWDGKELFNYDKKTGDLLTLRNIASDYNNLEKTIENRIINHIKNNYPHIVSNMEELRNKNLITNTIESEVNRIMSMDGNWGFTEEGIEINLPKSSIGTSADGIINITIDKSYINPYLLEEYKIK